MPSPTTRHPCDRLNGTAEGIGDVYTRESGADRSSNPGRNRSDAQLLAEGITESLAVVIEQVV